ncbi:MAG: hypothetical protein GF310_00305 [candidate division Zixibacteria bacterium]|nr:hypothetical protein [candidate division Zixibacteria bacterium]
MNKKKFTIYIAILIGLFGTTHTSADLFHNHGIEHCCDHAVIKHNHICPVYAFAINSSGTIEAEITPEAPGDSDEYLEPDYNDFVSFENAGPISPRAPPFSA